MSAQIIIEIKITEDGQSSIECKLRKNSETTADEVLAAVGLAKHLESCLVEWAKEHTSGEEEPTVLHSERDAREWLAKHQKKDQPEPLPDRIDLDGLGDILDKLPQKGKLND